MAVWVLVGLWRTPPGADGLDDPRLLASFRHLDAEVARGEATRMQTLFPEGFVFTHALLGLAWAEVAADASLPADVQSEASRALGLARTALESPEALAPFDPSLDPPYGAFYAGWTLWLDAAHLASSPEAHLAPFQEKADTLAAAFQRSLDSTGSPFPVSYPGSAWPADALAGMAALARHDRLHSPRYTELSQRWIRAVRERVDPQSGLIAHAADPASGAPMGGIRGSSQALMLRAMAEIDPDLGREMYSAFRDRFVQTRVGLPLVTEYPAGATGPPDIDSGPTPLGVSLPGTVVAIGTARAYGDLDLARGLGQTVEAFGMPLAWRGKRSYALGAMPVGDAFLAWARSTAPEAESSGEWPPLAGASRLPVSALALLLLVLGAWPLARTLSARGRARS